MGSRVTPEPVRWTSGAEDEGADPLVPLRIFWLLLDSVVHMANTWNYCLFCLNIRPKTDPLKCFQAVTHPESGEVLIPAGLPPSGGLRLSFDQCFNQL